MPLFLLSSRRSWSVSGRAVAACLSLALIAPAFAQERSVEECAALSDVVERLECFDELAEQERASAAERGGWRVSRVEQPVKNLALILDSTSSIQRMPFSFVPKLRLRCAQDRLSADVDLGFDYSWDAEDPTRVPALMRLSGRPPADENMTVSDNRSRLAFENPTSLIRMLLEHDAMTFEVSPRYESTIRVQFDTRGLSEWAGLLEEACGVDLSSTRPVWRAGDEPVDGNTEGVVPPVAAADNARPVYPRVALRRGAVGTVEFRVVVRVDGSVTDIQLVSAPDPDYGLVDAARDAVETWRYQPALLGGEAVDAYLNVFLHFAGLKPEPTADQPAPPAS